MTLVDLYNLVLQRLEVTAAGESADASDVQVVAGWYASLYDMLLTKKLVTWGLTDDVPAFAVIPLVAMLAFLNARDFGKDPATYLDGALDLPQPSIAERQLRTQLAKNYISHTACSEYY